MVNLTTAKMIYSWQLRQRKNNYVLSFLFFDIMLHFVLLSSTFHGINRHELLKLRIIRAIINTYFREVFMVLEIINIVAIIVIPILAVLIGQWLQNKSEKRKDKMRVFSHLMSYRAFSYTDQNSVNIFNSVPILMMIKML